jgi:VanZ family protein
VTSGRYRTFFLEYWLPLLIWLTTIYFFSTDAFSSDQTSGIVGSLLNFLFPTWSSDRIDLWHGVIRKLGHIAEYFILGTLTYRCLTHDQRDPAAAKAVTLLVLLAAAGVDEFHQSLTISRGASVLDVGYDGLGGLGALLLATAIERRQSPQRSSYESRRLHPHSIL